MRRTVLVYGGVAGVLIAVLQAFEHRFLVVEHVLEIYGGLVALLFAALGIRIGLRPEDAPSAAAVRSCRTLSHLPERDP